MQTLNNYLTPLAIFFGLGLIAAALFFSGGFSWPFSTSASAAERNGSPAWVYGNPKAAVTIVEFSDFECPFCARVHPILERIVDESDGAVKWQYRHFPLPIHRNAEIAARIGECVGREAGVDTFWDYSAIVFENHNTLSEAYLRDTARSLGLTDAELDSCLADPDIATQIAADVQAGRAFGGSGTPFSVIVFADGTTRSISGALPYEQWKSVLSQ